MGINGGMPLSYICQRVFQKYEVSNPGHRTASVITTVDCKQGDQMSFWKIAQNVAKTILCQKMHMWRVKKLPKYCVNFFVEFSKKHIPK
jgi:hypothetical protein